MLIIKQKYNYARRLGVAALSLLLAMQTSCTNNSSLASRPEGSPFCNTTGSHRDELTNTTKKGKWLQLRYILNMTRPEQFSQDTLENVLNNKSLTGQQKAEALQNMIAKMFSGKLSARKKAKYLVTIVASVMRSELLDDEKLAVIKNINSLIPSSNIQTEEELEELGKALINIAAYIRQHGQQKRGSIPSLDQFAEALLDGTFIKDDRSNEHLVLQNNQMGQDVLLVLDHLCVQHIKDFSTSVSQRIMIETFQGVEKKNGALHVKDIEEIQQEVNNQFFQKQAEQQKRKPKKFRRNVKGYRIRLGK